MLTGLKTYLIAALAALAALIALFNGTIGVFVVAQTVLGALSLASVRAAIKKLEVASALIPDPISGFIPGTKTYLSSAILAGVAIFAWFSGEQSFLIAALIVMAAIGVSTLRLAIGRVIRAVRKHY